MSVLTSALSSRAADFVANAHAMQAAVADLRAQLQASALGGGEAARAKQLARGKLPPRERVALLLDPGTPFLELSPLAALAMYPDRDGSDSTLLTAPSPLEKRSRSEKRNTSRVEASGCEDARTMRFRGVATGARSLVSISKPWVC